MARRPYYVEHDGNYMVVNATSAKAAREWAQSQEEFTVRQATPEEIDVYTSMSGCPIDNA